MTEILYCQSPALFLLAVVLLICFLLRRQAHRVRAALDLRSASFAISYDSAEDLFTIHTQGYGHGVGLSQYGADYMARQGADFKEILTHYYTGVELAVLD